MKINEVRKKEVDITLNSDELVMLGNLIYFYEQHYGETPDASAPGSRFHELAQQVIIARDLCQYGHLDTFTLTSILRHSVAADPEKRLPDVKHALGLMGKEEYVEQRVEQIKDRQETGGGLV